MHGGAQSALSDSQHRKAKGRCRGGRERGAADQRKRQYHEPAAQADLILNRWRGKQLQQQRAEIQQDIEIGEEVRVALRSHIGAGCGGIKLKIDEQAGQRSGHCNE